MTHTYETCGMTLFKEVDDKLVKVADFQHGMDDDMEKLESYDTIFDAYTDKFDEVLDLEATNADLLEALELARDELEPRVLDNNTAWIAVQEAIRKAKS